MLIDVLSSSLVAALIFDELRLMPALTLTNEKHFVICLMAAQDCLSRSALVRRRSSSFRSSGLISGPKSSGSKIGWMSTLPSMSDLSESVGYALRPLECFFHRIHFPDPETGDDLACFREWTIRNDSLPAGKLDPLY